MSKEERLYDLTGHNLLELRRLRTPDRIKLAWSLYKTKKLNKEQYNWLLYLKHTYQQLELGQQAKDVLALFGGEVIE